MKKKFLHQAITFVLTALILLSIAPRPAMAASASFTGDATAAPGSTVTLTLSVSGANIYGLTATLNCGTGLSVANYGCSVSGWSLEVNGSKFSAYGTSSTSGAILTVTLKVSDSVGSAAALNASFNDIVASDGENDINLGTASWTGASGAAKRSDAKLYGITVANVAYTPAFNSDVFTYTATVPYSVEKLSLDYFRNNNGSTVTISGNKLSVGENTITFKVVSEDGKNTNYYKLLVTRQADPNYKKSDDATLSALTLDVGDLSPAFDPDITDYVAYVPFETEKVTASATASSSKSTGLTGTDALTLKDDADNVLTVTCSAEDGTTRKSYTVHIVRMPKYEGILPTVILGEPEPEVPEEPVNPCTCGAAEGEAHRKGCPLYVEPETPMYKLPLTVALPLVGQTSTLVVGGIALLLLLVIVFLLGMLIGQPRSRDVDPEELDGSYEDPPRPPKNQGFMTHRPGVTAGGSAREEGPVSAAAPQERSVKDSAPHAEAPRPQPSREPVRTAPAPEADAEKAVEDMSLDDLLRDIHDL